jgi:acyl-CoA dehydrogenase
VHGGIGFTFEHPLHRYYKRALALESALGYGRELRAEIAKFLLSS